MALGLLLCISTNVLKVGMQAYDTWHGINLLKKGFSLSTENGKSEQPIYTLLFLLRKILVSFTIK